MCLTSPLHQYSHRCHQCQASFEEQAVTDSLCKSFSVSFYMQLGKIRIRYFEALQCVCRTMFCCLLADFISLFFNKVQVSFITLAFSNSIAFNGTLFFSKPCGSGRLAVGEMVLSSLCIKCFKNPAIFSHSSTVCICDPGRLITCIYIQSRKIILLLSLQIWWGKLW